MPLDSMERVIASVRIDTGTQLDTDTLRALLHDLESRFLVRVGDIAELPEYESKKSMMLREESAVRPPGVTAQGERFLSFVRN